MTGLLLCEAPPPLFEEEAEDDRDAVAEVEGVPFSVLTVEGFRPPAVAVCCCFVGVMVEEEDWR